MGHGGQRIQLAFSTSPAFVYWLTIALGGLFFVLQLHYLARRLECGGAAAGGARDGDDCRSSLCLLFIPVFFGMHDALPLDRMPRP